MLWKTKKNPEPQRKIKILPTQRSIEELHTKLPKIFDKPILLPEISNPNRIKHFLKKKHSESMPVIHIPKITPSKNFTNRENRISGINSLIRTCEGEKDNKNNLLLFEINKTEHELQKVVEILDN